MYLFIEKEWSNMKNFTSSFETSQIKLFTSLGKELNRHAIMVKVIETSSWCNVKQRKLSDSYY